MKGMRLYNDRFRLEEEIRSGGFATVFADNLSRWRSSAPLTKVVIAKTS